MSSNFGPSRLQYEIESHEIRLSLISLIRELDGVPTNALCLYHEDPSTENRRMIQIPTHGLFLTCTENSFYSAQTYIYSSGYVFA
jgi:hypothetical protein